MIKHSAVDDFLRRKLESFLWMKKLTHEDIDAEFKQYKVKPVFKGEESWLHQKICFHIGMCRPEFLFLLDMGTGKTRILLNLITQRLREKKLKRALVTVNSQLTIDSWDTSIAKYSDLEPVIINSSTAEEKWEKLISPSGDIAVIDYTGLHLALSKKIKQGKKHVLLRDDAKVKQLKKIYNFYDADESQELRNTDTLRFAIIRALTKEFDYRYASTGTPMGRNPEDMFSQFLLVDHGETFSDTLGMFREAFFLKSSNGFATEWIFDKRKERLFNQFMQHRSIRYLEAECGDIPTCHPVSLKLDFTTEQREHYLQAVQGLINAGGKLSEMDNNYHRMRQIVAGYMHWHDEYGEHTVRFEHNVKLEMLRLLLEDSGSSKFVVSHEYTESGKMITEMLDELKIGYEWVWGGTKDKVAALHRFLTDRSKRVWVMNSEVGGTGTDGLQDVVRYLVFYESPTSPITRKQVIKRVHRAGQTKRTFIYDLIIKKSIDIRVLEFIAEGNDLHRALVDGGSNIKQLLLI